VASLDAHWKDLPQLIVAVSFATVGTDPLRPDVTALRLTAQEKQELLSGIESTCSTLGGCSEESLKGRGVPAAVAVQRLMTAHLRKPWALNGTKLR
jgi:hypothetical protein